MKEYFHASSKKEAKEIIRKKLNITDFDIKLYKFMSKGNSMYELILP